MSTTQVLQFYERRKEQVASKADASRAHLLGLLVPDHKGWETRELEQPVKLYKVVASVKGNLVSAYDGVTQYHIGRWTHSKHGACSWTPLSACFYGFQEPDQALAAKFPKECKLLLAPKVLMQLEGSGKAYFHPRTGMWAVPSVRPSRILPGTVHTPHHQQQEAAWSSGAESARGCTPVRVSSARTSTPDGKGNPWVP